ncbi:peptide chain release factor N(5)-glutamine methyltransferase [Plantibacter sp. YIM 135249]|uniref:peptide chain release factor N(5)-glutamine methyltransferase n=1 Tax=Plantibacter sp. YIM 135249 TaxID=3423918 RepID=UPI003D32B834
MQIPSSPSPVPSGPSASGLPTTVADARERAIGILTTAGVPSADVDAELLIGHVLGLGRGAVQAAAITGRAIEAVDAAELATLVERRSAREPLQHITGRAAFRSLELAVGPGVFVPRPETETVVQFAIDALRAVPTEHPVGVDLGTGSGAIALAMATEVPHASIHAAENSVDAFIWTKQNFREFGADNTRLVFEHLADAFHDLDGTVDVVISNPPYVPDEAIPRDPEVRLHDPAAALYGGPDGLDVVREVSTTAARLLHPGGTLIIEHGELQGAAIRDILTADGWHAASTHRDLTLRDRATIALR